MTDTERKVITHDIRVKAARSRLRSVFRMDYRDTRYVMTDKQAADGAWRRESEFVEVVW